MNGTIGSASGQTWALGGAWADLRAPFTDAAVTASSAANPVMSGDTVYIGAGTYRSVISTPSVGFSPAFNGTVNIVGDVDGSKTGDAGMVQLTGYTTNDKTAPSSTTLLYLNGKSNMAFTNIMFVGGNVTLLTATTVTSQNITFQDCSFNIGFSATAGLVLATNAYPVPFNWLFDRCLFTTGSGSAMTFTVGTGAIGNDYDTGVLIRNCSAIGRTGPFVTVTASGALTFKPGGVRISAGFFYGIQAMSTGVNISTIIPCLVTGSLIESGATVALTANTSGQIVETYNLIVASTPRTNVTAGVGSVSDGSYAPLFHFGQETQWGGMLRRFGEPMAGSPLLGFGSQDPKASNPYDLRGNPRPAGLASPLVAVGALERSNTSVQASSPAPPSGTYVWKFTGPGYQDFYVPVDNTATTISCTVQRDSAYAGSFLPSISLLANGTIGVTGQTIYDTGGTASNNTIALAPFTPTAAGAVVIRIASQDLSGVSVVAFSVVTIT